MRGWTYDWPAPGSGFHSIPLTTKSLDLRCRDINVSRNANIVNDVNATHNVNSGNDVNVGHDILYKGVGRVPWTPTITVSAGTLTSNTVTGGYRRLGSLVYFSLSGTINQTGTMVNNNDFGTITQLYDPVISLPPYSPAYSFYVTGVTGSQDPSPISTVSMTLGLGSIVLSGATKFTLSAIPSSDFYVPTYSSTIALGRLPQTIGNGYLFSCSAWYETLT